jgi:nitrate/TMAO reductase-like tetraheme cytochrome c subunit
MIRNKAAIYGFVLLCVAIAVSAILTASCVKNDGLALSDFDNEEGSALAKSAGQCNLAVVVTGSTAGEFEPCGCGGVYEGGLSRRAAMFESLRKMHRNVLTVDTGDLTCGGEEIQFEFLAQAYHMLGYNAIALGEGDLRVDWADLNKYAAKYKLPIVASNLKFKTPTVFREVIPIEVAGIRMAVISVVSERWLGIVPERNRQLLSYELPEKALGRLVPQLKKKYDAVVLLSHLGAAEREKLGSHLSGVDLWIDSGSHQRIGRQNAQQASTSEPEFYVAGHNPPLLISWSNDRKIGVAGLRWNGGKFSVPAAELIPVSKEIKGDPKYLEIYDAYKYVSRQNSINQIMNPRLRTSTRPVKVFPYESSSTCASCHQEIYDFWKTTKHGVAYATIQKDNRDADTNCLTCHTTGYRDPGGFENLTTTPGLKDVGCQMCHRIDLKNHHTSSDPELARFEKIRAKANNTTDSWQCQRCHVPHRSPKYNYISYLKKIKCSQALTNVPQQAAQTTTQPLAQ